MSLGSPQIVPVVLCGGSGTRLWPLSRKGFPKQFLSFNGKDTLLQTSVKRLLSLKTRGHGIFPPILVSNEDHRFIVKEQLQQLGESDFQVLLEPVGKNTAPAVTLAALSSIEDINDPIIVVTPSDHVITDEEAFINAIELAIREAAMGSLVILGIQPDGPKIGYGYIKVKEAKKNGTGTMDVLEFVEKPNLSTAQEYVASGNYYWNAGIFIFKAEVWLEALNNLDPEMNHLIDDAWKGRSAEGVFVRPKKEPFAKIKSDSVDYAVLEKCQSLDFDLKMIPLAAGWNDLGAWDAVWEMSEQDASGNVLLGDVLAHDSNGNLVISNNRLVGLVGVENLVVIETPDAILVANRSQSQNVKTVVSRLNELGRAEHELHRKVFRPWGWYDSIDSGERFQVKRIGVKPSASLSLQLHQHRAEHWVVVRGIAEVTRGEEVFLLHENESTYISKGEIHRLRNPGEIELEIIEIQSGSYLGEDDIVRIEDTYGRA